MTRLTLVIVLGGCAGARPAPIHEIGRPEVYDARVVSALGPVVPQIGDPCRIEVDGTDDGIFNCRIVVECGGDRVYGLPDRGFNACHAEDGRFVFARDRSGTRSDGDPRLFFDLLGGHVTIADDAPDIQIEIAIGDPSGPPPARPFE